MKSKPVYAAVAYVSDVKDLPLEEGDMLVCDASRQVAEAGGTTATALQELVENGVSVWSMKDLHAKVLVCGGTAIVGSANWSHAAENRKVEAVIETDEPSIVAAAKRFVRSLRDRGAVPVDATFLRKMPNPDFPERKDIGAPSARAEIRHWLRDTGPLPRTRELQEIKKEYDKDKCGFEDDGEADWLIYRDSDTVASRVVAGDTVTEIWSPEPGGNAVVYPPRRVLKTARKGSFVGILTLASANEESRTVPWRVFRKVALEAGVRRNVTQRSALQLGEDTAKALQDWWSGHQP